jgi:hypothetical protein
MVMKKLYKLDYGWKQIQSWAKTCEFPSDLFEVHDSLISQLNAVSASNLVGSSDSTTQFIDQPHKVNDQLIKRWRILSWNISD